MLITWNKHGPKLFQHSTAWHCHTGRNKWTGQTQEDRLHPWPVFPPVPLEQSQEMLSWSSPVVLEQQRKRLWVRKNKKRRNYFQQVSGSLWVPSFTSCRLRELTSYPWPNVVVGSAQCPDDNAQLVDVIFSGKYRRSIDHFAENAANWPQIHAFRVGSRPVQELRSSAKDQQQKMTQIKHSVQNNFIC